MRHLAVQNQLDASCRSKSKDVRSRVMSVKFLRRKCLPCLHLQLVLGTCPPAKMAMGWLEPLDPPAYFPLPCFITGQVIQLEGRNFMHCYNMFLMPTMFCPTGSPGILRKFIVSPKFELPAVDWPPASEVEGGPVFCGDPRYAPRLWSVACFPFSVAETGLLPKPKENGWTQTFN